MHIISSKAEEQAVLNLAYAICAAARGRGFGTDRVIPDAQGPRYGSASPSTRMPLRMAGGDKNSRTGIAVPACGKICWNYGHGRGAVIK